MVLGWRRAFCTSIPRDEEKQQSPSAKLSSRFGFFSSSSSSAPSTPRSHSRPISGPTGSNLRCRTRAAVPAESPKVEQECKSTMKSPRFFSFSNPSSPRSPSTFSSFLKSKVIEEKTRSTNTIDHVNDENKRSQKPKSMPILKVYNDDEPLMLPTSIPESEEENNDDNFVEFRGFFVNAANTCRNAIGVSLLPEAAAVSGDNYVVVLKVKAPAKTARRAPIDLVVVLDVSGKMTSEKLQMMKRAMRLVISSLSAADRLSIVAFSTASKRLLPLRRMTLAGRRSVRRIVDAVVALDGTSATATDALKKAVKVLEDRRDRNPAASIILLSDEQYHSSATASASASAFASQKRRQFVCSTRFSHLEIPVHSVALIAFDHAPHEDLFAKSISDLLSVVVQDLKIQLGFISGSNRDKIAAVYSHIGRPTALGSGSIRLGELYAEEERELLVELKVPSSAPIGFHRVLSVKYSYTDPSTQVLINCKEEAFLVPLPHTVNSATSTRLRNLFITTRAVAEARRLVERNELAGAHHMLASARALLFQSGSGSGWGDEFVNGLEAELRELHLRRQNQVRQSPRQKMYVERDGFAYVDEKGEPLTPTSAWRAAEMLAKLAVTRKSLNRVSDLHGFENARF